MDTQQQSNGNGGNSSGSEPEPNPEINIVQPQVTSWTTTIIDPDTNRRLVGS